MQAVFGGVKQVVRWGNSLQIEEKIAAASKTSSLPLAKQLKLINLSKRAEGSFLMNNCLEQFPLLFGGGAGAVGGSILQDAFIGKWVALVANFW